MPQVLSLAIFPLSDVVLLPEATAPLYIFEPRYRQMTRDALEGSGLIGMVTVRPGNAHEMAGNPPIFEVGCLGRIAHAAQQPDGTYQIVLLGQQRFRVLSEDPPDTERLYRQAQVELLADVEPGNDVERKQLEKARAELTALLLTLIRRAGSDEPDRVLEPLVELTPANYVNTLTRSISFQPIERQQLLEADSIVGRFETMSDLLRFRLAESGDGTDGAARLPN